MLTSTFSRRRSSPSRPLSRRAAGRGSSSGPRWGPFLLALPTGANADAGWLPTPAEFHDIVASLVNPAWMLIPITLLAVATLLWSWSQRRQAARRTRQLQRELNERRRVEMALRESEARLRDVTEAASDWIWEMD